MTVTVEVGVCKIVEIPTHEHAEETLSQEYPLSTEGIAEHLVETVGEAPASALLWRSVLYRADITGASRFLKLLPLLLAGTQVVVVTVESLWYLVTTLCEVSVCTICVDVVKEVVAVVCVL